MQAVVLPARVVYLIRNESAEGLRMAVREASSRWGGVSEPIVAVTDSGEVKPRFADVVEAADVDSAVNVDLPDDLAEQTAGQLKLPLVSLDRIDVEGVGRFTCHPSTVLPGGTETGKALVIAQDDGPLWQVTAAGDLDAAYLEDMNTSNIGVHRPMSDVAIGQAQLLGLTLLESGASQFSAHAVSGGLPGGPSLVWITEPDSFEDCLWFWNYRALNPRSFWAAPVLLLPRDAAQRWEDYGRQLADKALRLRNVEVSPDAILFSLSVPKPELQEIAERLSLEPDAGDRIRVRAGSQLPQHTEPFTYFLNQDPASLLVCERSWGAVTSFDAHMFSGESSIRFASPVEFHGLGRTLVRLSGAAFDGLPRQPVVADMIKSGAAWHRDSIQLHTDASPNYLIPLTIPSLRDAAEAVLADATEHWELSSAGKVGTGMLEQHDPAVLLEQGVYEAVVGLTTPRSKELLKALKAARADGSGDVELVAIASVWGGRVERRYRSAEQLKGQGVPLLALERLCFFGWAERGLAAECPRCGRKTFVPLTGTAGSAPCPGCSAPAAYRGSGASLTIAYRLDTFIDHASDQGVLPHLLAIAALKGKEARSHFIPGANLCFPDSTDREVDIYGTYGGRLMAGEVKASPADFTPNQLEHDIDISTRLGVQVHLMASVNPIAETTRTAAQRACHGKGLELLILDKQDLRP